MTDMRSKGARGEDPGSRLDALTKRAGELIPEAWLDEAFVTGAESVSVQKYEHGLNRFVERFRVQPELMGMLKGDGLQKFLLHRWGGGRYRLVMVWRGQYRGGYEVSVDGPPTPPQIRRQVEEDGADPVLDAERTVAREIRLKSAIRMNRLLDVQAEMPDPAPGAEGGGEEEMNLETVLKIVEMVQPKPLDLTPLLTLFSGQMEMFKLMIASKDAELSQYRDRLLNPPPPQTAPDPPQLRAAMKVLDILGEKGDPGLLGRVLSPETANEEGWTPSRIIEIVREGRDLLPMLVDSLRQKALPEKSDAQSDVTGSRVPAETVNAPDVLDAMEQALGYIKAKEYLEAWELMKTVPILNELPVLLNPDVKPAVYLPRLKYFLPAKHKAAWGALVPDLTAFLGWCQTRKQEEIKAYKAMMEEEDDDGEGSKEN